MKSSVSPDLFDFQYLLVELLAPVADPQIFAVLAGVALADSL